MKTNQILIWIVLMVVVPFYAEAQLGVNSKRQTRKGFNPVHEAGFMIGINQQRSDINNLYVIDLSSVNIGAGFYYRYTFHRFLAASTTLSYYRLDGADKFVRDKKLFSNGWFRYVRNLSFRTDVLEFAGHMDFHILPYEPFEVRQDRWTPYVSAGIGGIFFNPKTYFQDEWVSLQPLGTEGQGRPGYADKYSRLTWAAPIRLGFKYNVSEQLIIQSFFGYTFTGTDYLDDVSTVYADPDDLGSFVADIAVRADEVVGPEVYGRITAPGEQRGDPGDKDGFWMFGVSVSVSLHKKSDYMRCNKW